MKQYKKYMDNIQVSDTLHQRLLDLEAPAKRPAAWKKYGTAAAALVLVAGVGGYGAWAAHNNNLEKPLPPYPAGYQENRPELGGPDIAVEDPNESLDPGMKTIGGYEVYGEDRGPNTAVSYYMLPYIEYGPPSGVTVDSLLATPDGGLRGAGRDDALALIGNEDALAAHLGWGGFEFGGTVGFEADGTVWMMSLWGEGADAAFSLELSPDRLPPTCCVVMGEQRTITNVWGVEVSGVKDAGAYGDTERGVYMDVSREVEFIAHGVGCRLTVYGNQDGVVEELVSRFVRWAVLEGLDLSGISPDGAKPLEADPNYSVGEPNWNDGADEYDSDCPYCVDGRAHTHPHNPGLPAAGPDSPTTEGYSGGADPAPAKGPDDPAAGNLPDGDPAAYEPQAELPS